MIVEFVPLVVVTNAPELSAVPQEFWQTLRAFVSGGKTGRVTWHFNGGNVEMLEATEHVRRSRRRTVDTA